MLRPPILSLAVMFALAPAVCRADPSPSTLSADSTKSLSSALRAVLIQAIPKPLYEASPGWGHTREVADAIHWEKGKILRRPKIVKAARNDGIWRKIKATAQNLDRTLVCELRNVNTADPEHLTFSVALAFDVDIDYEKQRWEGGVRLYAGSVRARARVYVTLDCEAQMRLEAGKSFVPDAVIRLHVLRANVGYDQLVFEHVSGVGGTAAQVLGNSVHHALQKWRPSLERDLLAKADAAIVRAGNAREVRISLGSLIGKSLEQPKTK